MLFQGPEGKEQVAPELPGALSEKAKMPKAPKVLLSKSDSRTRNLDYSQRFPPETNSHCENTVVGPWESYVFRDHWTPTHCPIPLSSSNLASSDNRRKKVNQLSNVQVPRKVVNTYLQYLS